MEPRLLQEIYEKLRQIKDIIFKIEFEYKIKRKNKYEIRQIDLLIQYKHTICIFEIKKKRSFKKAKMQLKAHKDYLLNNKSSIVISGKLMPNSRVKSYYISEEDNTIIDLENNEFHVLGPTFLENLAVFLVG